MDESGSFGLPHQSRHFTAQQKPLYPSFDRRLFDSLQAQVGLEFAQSDAVRLRPRDQVHDALACLAVIGRSVRGEPDLGPVGDGLAGQVPVVREALFVLLQHRIHLINQLGQGSQDIPGRDS